MPPQQVALVTGSATGVGRATAVRFARRGFAVAVNYSRSQDEANETLAEVRRLGVPAILCRATVGDDAQVRAIVDRCRAELGGLDVLVNNAGMTHFIPHTDLEAVTDEIWVNCAPGMRPRNGHPYGRACGPPLWVRHWCSNSTGVR
jgi:NAD(P)-dependent dehydrogenase (short-subunit alcohol dehydrogenase family)